MEDKFSKYAEATAFLKLMANTNRLAVLCNLQEQRLNVTELAALTGLPQAAMSNQLALLREAGLVDCEVNHRERLYYITDERVTKTIKLLYSFFCEDNREAENQ
ncbi:ArsR/SmtB family transcription factor [Neisseria wadsworthii]|uniref:ArsR family transcriptional regulator n=1 Tax=Neisseria wadsworthii 9715 TaxID=1030841 RepID=G4CS90_9NEIS|nr:metalloregulator ArsR/SmtB family transcription factor [Neisseria wadsworthii]EGZ44835.1 ArsR family transcriptional regulator [Neisseria wadsworthii 9715]QMT35595.1 winged helix-turn-helix transcriptional regulator [Neisseria wadsworthii]